MKKDIDMDYFEDEVRDGFLIPSMVKRLWASELKSYSVLDGECESRGVFASVIFGTLLGAIRHGGYIPWDDDIDVEMVRDKYLVLEKANTDGELPGDYHISDYKQDYGENMVRRWMSSDSLVEPYEKWEERYGFPFVSIIDIFLQDYLPTEEKEKKHYWDVMERAGAFRVQIRELDNKTISKIKGDELKKLGWELGYRFDAHSEIPLSVQVMMAMDEFCLSYKDKGCDHIGVTAYTYNNPARVIPKNLYAHHIKMKFEYGEVSVPIGYDGIMRRNFGDYMTPVLNFGIHGYPSYRKMNDDAKRLTGFELTRYHYDESSINLIKEKRKEKQAQKISIAETLGEYMQMLVDAHEYIVAHIDDSPQEVSELIGQCQDLAIQMGEYIENNSKNPDNTVSILESYCEHIYAMFQAMSIELNNDDSVSTVLVNSNIIDDEKEDNLNNNIYVLCDKLTEFNALISEGISDLVEKKKIVFLTYKSKYWSGLHTMWSEAVDAGYDVSVIAVPYYYRNFRQEIDKTKMVCETEGYPDDVELIPYDAYDFDANHPDRIVCQYPYDEFGGAYVLHPFYYMTNLYQYTDELVLVQPYMLREIQESDIQPRYTWGVFLKTPGIVIADKVYVQSDNMRAVSIDILREFIVEDSAERNLQEDRIIQELEDKIVATELPIEQWNKLSRVLIADGEGNIFAKDGTKTNKDVYDDVIVLSDDIISKLKKTDGGFKKVILYRTCGTVLYEHGIDEVKRVEKAIEILQSQYDSLICVWTEDPYAEDILKKYSPQVWDEYAKIRKEYIERDKGVFIPAKSDDDMKRILRYEDNHKHSGYSPIGEVGECLVRIADGYYGDACPEMNEMRILGKHVMWATPGTPI